MLSRSLPLTLLLSWVVFGVACDEPRPEDDAPIPSAAKQPANPEPRTAELRASPEMRAAGERRAIPRIAQRETEHRIELQAPPQHAGLPRLEAQARPPERRISVDRLRVRELPRIAVGRARELRPTSLRDLDPAAFIAAVERSTGPLNSAHYVLQRGSETVVEGRSYSVDGALSVIDCTPVDPEDYERGIDLWFGGLRLEDGPEVFASVIEENLVLSLFSSDDLRMVARWEDGRLRRGQLRSFRRLLDGGVDAELRDAVSVWRRELTLDLELDNAATMYSSDDPCPVELVLHLRVKEILERWVPRAGDDGSVRPYRESVEEIAELGRATLYARWVSDTPEIIDRSQRVMRMATRLSARELTTGTVPRIAPRRELTTGTVPRIAPRRELTTRRLPR